MKNNYEIIGNKVHIKVDLRKKGTEITAIVDFDDFDKVSSIPGKWHAQHTKNAYYIKATLQNENAKYNKVYLHRFIMDCDVNNVVDHINGDPLNNTRNNLRIVSHDENKRNRSRANSTSGTKVRCVRWHKQAQKYQAYCRYGGKFQSLGLYATIEEAERVAREYELSYTG